MTMSELRNDRHLSVHDLRRRINEGDIDTVVVAFTDMQGRLQGKRMHGGLLRRHVLEHGTEGCNYLLAVDIDMNTVDGYAISSWDRGYGDFEFVLDLGPSGCCRTSRARPWSSATWSGWTAPRSRSHRARSCSRQLDRVAERGLVALAGTELEFIVFTPPTRTPRRRATTTWCRSTRTTSTTRSSAERGRAAAARDPQHDVRRRAGRRVGQGGVQLRPARDRLPVRRRADHRRQPCRVQDRGQGDRRPGGLVDHLHGQVQRARGQLLPHPPVAARTPTATRCCSGDGPGLSPGAARCTTPSSPGSAPRCATSPAVRPQHQLLQALRPAASPPPRSPGARTTGPARCGWSAAAQRPAGEPGARRRRQPLPRPGRDGRRGAVRHRARARAGART